MAPRVRLSYNESGGGEGRWQRRPFDLERARTDGAPRLHSALERLDLLSKGARHRDGLTFVARCAEERPLRRRHQRVVLDPVGRMVVGDARRPDALDTDEHLEPGVEP